MRYLKYYQITFSSPQTKIKSAEVFRPVHVQLHSNIDDKKGHSILLPLEEAELAPNPPPSSPRPKSFREKQLELFTNSNLVKKKVNE